MISTLRFVSIALALYAAVASCSSSPDGGSSSPDGGSSSPDGGSSAPTPADLMKLTTTCTQASNGLYKASDSSPSATVPICKLDGAFFWTAGMNIDCDGKTTAACSLDTDPAYQVGTSANDSMGNLIDATIVPYVVIPLPDSKFDYMAEGIELGDVVAVIYNGKVTYGVFADEGPTDLIGEASVAMATSFGIDADPLSGGVECCGVTYIVFHGSGAVVNPIEDHDKATALGQQLATQLLQR